MGFVQKRRGIVVFVIAILSVLLLGLFVMTPGPETSKSENASKVIVKSTSSTAAPDSVPSSGGGGFGLPFLKEATASQDGSQNGSQNGIVVSGQQAANAGSPGGSPSSTIVKTGTTVAAAPAAVGTAPRPTTSAAKAPSSSAPPATQPPPSYGERTSAKLTSYHYYNNYPTPRAIARPAIHSQAGGIGTYDDPITISTPTDGSNRRFSAGTRFYVPAMRKYFVAEDLCDTCGRATSSGVWLEMWVDDSTVSKPGEGVRDCALSLEATREIYINPGRGFAVTAGSLYSGGSCFRP